MVAISSPCLSLVPRRSEIEEEHLVHVQCLRRHGFSSVTSLYNSVRYVKLNSHVHINMEKNSVICKTAVGSYTMQNFQVCDSDMPLLPCKGGCEATSLIFHI